METPKPPGNASPRTQRGQIPPHPLGSGADGAREAAAGAVGVTKRHLPVSRYRKIPGDKCSGGESPSREETDMKKKCTSNFLNPSQLVGDGDTGRAR